MVGWTDRIYPLPDPASHNFETLEINRSTYPYYYWASDLEALQLQNVWPGSSLNWPDPLSSFRPLWLSHSSAKRYFFLVFPIEANREENNFFLPLITYSRKHPTMQNSRMSKNLWFIQNIKKEIDKLLIYMYRTAIVFSIPFSSCCSQHLFSVDPLGDSVAAALHNRPFFTTLEFRNPLHDVPDSHKIHRSPELQALKLWKGRSGK